MKVKYKAKNSYKTLSNLENFVAHGKSSVHLWLLEGRELELKDVPKKILEHLTETKKQKK